MKSKILINIMHLLFSTAFTRILNMVLILALARCFDSKYYGMFSVAIALSMILGYFTDVGMNNIAIRESSKQDRDTAHVFSNYVKIRLLLLIVTLILSVVFIESFYKDRELQQIIYLIVFPMVIGLSIQSVCVTFFQFRQEMSVVAKIRNLSAVLQIIFVLLAITITNNIFIICFLYSISYIVAGIYGAVIFARNITISFQYKWDSSMFAGVLPFILSGIFIVLLPQIGPLILERTLSYEELGMYSLAYRIPAALYAIPGVVAGAFYPILFKRFNESKSLHLKTNLNQIKIMSSMGLMISVILFFSADFIIRVFFGASWDEAAKILQITSLIVFLQSVSIPLADGLTTSNFQSRRTFVQFFVLTIGICLYFVCSIKMGAIGAAYSAVLIEFLQVSLLTAVNKNRIILLKEVWGAYLLIPMVIILLVSYFLSNYMLLAILISTLCITIFIFVIDSEITLQKILSLKKYLLRNI